MSTTTLVAATLVAASASSNFTYYPQTSTQSLPRIEAITDRGPILELIVKCRVGSTIVAYSKIERVYCDPRNKCSPDQATVIARSCG